MKSFIFLFLFIGLILVVVGYVKSNQQCPPPTVQFRYVPKTFTDEQSTPIPLVSIFGKMFEDASPWQSAVGYATNWNKEYRDTSDKMIPI